jgi:hypothetical protein
VFCGDIFAQRIPKNLYLPDTTHVGFGYFEGSTILVQVFADFKKNSGGVQQPLKKPWQDLQSRKSREKNRVQNKGHRLMNNDV